MSEVNQSNIYGDQNTNTDVEEKDNENIQIEETNYQKSLRNHQSDNNDGDKSGNDGKKKLSLSMLFFVGFLVGTILSTVIFTACFYLVNSNKVREISWQSRENMREENDSESEASTSENSKDTSSKDGKNTVLNDATMQKVALLQDTIDSYYLDADQIDSKKLANGLYSGMLESLEDPYSVYYTKEQLNDLMDDTEGIYYGIGAYISTNTDLKRPVISGIISGTPAEEAKLQDGDICMKVDGEDTEGMELSTFVSKVKGKEGTKVTLTISREGVAKPFDVKVERRKVESPTVKYEMKDNKIGYIRITEFDSVTPDQFKDAMATLKGQGMKGLVIDLRSNPGGSLTAVCDIAEQLLPKGKIVYTIDRAGNRKDYNCDGKNEFKLPMAVLVNEYSASASEILSGAIKDYKKGTLIGTTTFGKGIVQRIIPFSDGTAVKLTVSKYYTPNGHNIHKIGIEPDIKVELDTEAFSKKGKDNQLDAALKNVKDKF
ncbi:S41 family peptidase [Butyrivibrio sp. NC3005]|uniref:S41 family peptidase n=1 Tax=Butyrivibrio sp. NC3005 TaxID=1280685 RepID=UPI000411A4B5|nr:S41 family peptidase [Butyrivibrio sp. NC3005]